MANSHFKDTPEQQAVFIAMQLAAAKYRLHLFHRDDAIKLADDALNAGIYSDALRELAVDTNDSSNFGTLLLQSLADFDVTMPQPKQAVLNVICHHMERILNGDDPPISGLVELQYTLGDSSDWAMDESGRGNISVDDLVDRLYSLYYAQLDLDTEGKASFKYRGQSSTDAVGWLEQDIMRLAKDWVRSDECSGQRGSTRPNDAAGCNE